MEEREPQKPRLLVVATPSYVRSINKGYVPEDKQAYDSKSGEIELISIDKLLDSRYELETRPILKSDEGEMMQVYLYDPSESLYKVPRLELEDNLVKAHLLVYADILERMGAKSISLCEESELQEGSTFSTNTQAKGTKVGLGADLKVATDNESKFKRIIKSALNYSLQENQPRSVEDVELAMRRHGLERDATLRLWLDNLREGRLMGTRELSFDATREAENTFKLLGDLSGSVKAVELGLSTEVKYKSYLVERYICTLKVQF